MTDQNNAAQAADTTPFSDEYVNAVIQQHGYDSPECVIARLHQWIGLHGGENGLTLLMYEAHKALIKLRAPVADEDDQPTAPDDDAIAECWVTASDCDGIAYDGPSFERGYRMGEIAERDRAALASAPVAIPGNTLTGDGSGVALPVAGEAPPTDWQTALRIAELPEVDEALAVFCNDGTLDNAVGLVQAILDAAPQASTVDGLPVWWERFMNELTLRSEDEVRNDLAGILEICALDAIASAAPQASDAVQGTEHMAPGLGDVVLPRLPPITHKWAALISDSMARALENWARAYTRTAILADRQQRAGNADEYEKMRDVLQWIVDDAASGGVVKLRPQQEKRARAALSAQPAEKPATSAPSPAASQRQAMVPGSQESGNSHTDGGAVYA